MASAAFREEGFEPAGAEMVRRLLSHSTRARSSAAAARSVRPGLSRLADELQGAPSRDASSEIADLEDEVVRLKTELRVVRAALEAEQAESASLRSELDQASVYATPVGDIRHDRDRWASLVERLLFVER